MRLVYVMVFFNGCSGCFCADDEPESSSGCGVPCEPGDTQQCSCGCGVSGEAMCIAPGEWGVCMCEGFDPPDLVDGALDVRFDVLDRDGSTDGSTDVGFRPRPGLDATADGEQPDAVVLRPTPTPPDPPTSYADAWRLTVSSAAAPTTAPDGRSWDVDETPPDLRVDVMTPVGVVLQTTVATDSYRAEFTDDANVLVAVTEPVRFELHDVDDPTLGGPTSEIVLDCEPRVTEEIRESGGVLQCRNRDARIEVQAEAVFRE